jgi:Calcium-binding EGF domain
MKLADIDECKIYGTCSQRCHNWQGGYACSCESGYVLAADEKTCFAEKGIINKCLNT